MVWVTHQNLPSPTTNAKAEPQAAASPLFRPRPHAARTRLCPPERHCRPARLTSEPGRRRPVPCFRRCTSAPALCRSSRRRCPVPMLCLSASLLLSPFLRQPPSLLPSSCFGWERRRAKEHRRPYAGIEAAAVRLLLRTWPGRADRSPSWACLAVVVCGPPHLGASYTVSYRPTMVDGARDLGRGER